MQPPQPPYGGQPPPPPGMGCYGPPPGPPGPPGSPGWGPPPGPPRRNNNGAIVIVVIAAVVVLIGGGAGIIWLFNKGEDAASAVSSPTPSFPSLPSFDTPTIPSFTPPPSPTFPEEPPTSSPVFDPQPGDCVRNSGTFTRPILHISGCTPGHYRIIDRIDGTTNKNRCNGTGYTYAVWYYNPKFLLCMRRL
jgi:hypothetical protein